MANIESKLTTIKSAAGGEDVRDAIIGALRDINNDVPADMSNPVQKEYNMPQGSDLTVPLNPPELVSQIIVRQPGSGGKSTTLNDITVTENGVYPTDEEGYDPDKENRYYSKVTVKVPQLANAVVDLEEEITQNGTYSAPADWGVDGIRTFTVNVNAATGDGPFQVEFYDKPASDPTAAVIETQLVPKGGSAQCTLLDGTINSGGLSFKGWNPRSDNVTRDMKCYPQYGDVIITPGSITDDWSVICLDGGAHYPIGSYRSLIIGSLPVWDVAPDEIEYKNSVHNSSGSVYESVKCGDGSIGCLPIAMDMVKVAEGESGSTSTWLSTGAIHIVASGNHNLVNVGSNGIGFDTTLNGQSLYVFQGWGGSILETYLNNYLINAFPEALKNNIKPVTKYYTTNNLFPFASDNYNYFNLSGSIQVETSSIDKIWIPSYKEFHTLLANIQPDAYVLPHEESNGIDYTINYQPNYNNTKSVSGYVALRSFADHSTDNRYPGAVSLRYNNNGDLIRISKIYEQVFPIGFCL